MYRQATVEENVDDIDMAAQDKASESLAAIYTEMIGSIGLTGQRIAELSGTRPQYISDIKRRRRPLSRDMFMRTLLGLYGSHKWLISGDPRLDTKRIIALYPYISNPEAETYPLPVLQRPFLGPKMTADDWDGGFICVASPLMEKAKKMRNPYILHLPFNDKSGRLCKGDYCPANSKFSGTDASVLLWRPWW